MEPTASNGGSRTRLLIAAGAAVVVMGMLAWALDVRGVRFLGHSVAELREAKNTRGLRSKLRHGDPATRAEAAEALALSGKEAVPALISSLNDSSDVVRERVAGSLGEIGDPAAVPGLIAVLNGPVKDPSRDRYVRVAAARALGKIGGEAAAGAVTAQINDPQKDEWVRCEAIEIAVGTGDKRVQAALIEAAKDPVPAIRATAIRCLGMLGDKGVVPLLMRKLRTDDSSFARHAAVGALTQLRDQQALPALIEAFKDPDPLVSVAAAEAAVSMGGAKGVDALVAGLRHPSPMERLVAANVLAARGDARALPVLADFLKAKEWKFRNAAARSLSKLGPAAKPAIPALEKAVKDENALVRDSAEFALRVIRGEQAAPSPQSPESEGPGP